jgi:hypothetical protein
MAPAAMDVTDAMLFHAAFCFEHGSEKGDDVTRLVVSSGLPVSLGQVGEAQAFKRR